MSEINPNMKLSEGGSDVKPSGGNSSNTSENHNVLEDPVLIKTQEKLSRAASPFRDLLNIGHRKSVSEGGSRQRSPSATSDLGVYLTPPDSRSPIRDLHERPRNGSPGSDKGKRSSSSQSIRNTWEHWRGRYATGDVTLDDLLEGPAYEKLTKERDIDAQIKNLELIVDEWRMRQPIGAIERSMRRQREALDERGRTRQIGPDLTAQEAQDKLKALLERLQEPPAESQSKDGQPHQVSDTRVSVDDVSTTGKVTDNSFWDRITAATMGYWRPESTESTAAVLKKLSSSKESERDAAYEAVEKVLVAWHSRATARQEDFREIQRAAFTNSADRTTWVGKQREKIHKIEKKWLPKVEKGVNIFNDEPSKAIIGLLAQLDGLQKPEEQTFTATNDEALKSASIEQIMSEQSLARSDTMKTRDSAQEEINRQLRLENVTPMQEAIEGNIVKLQSNPNMERAEKSKLIQVSVLMNLIANEPLKRWETLKALRVFGNIDSKLQAEAKRNAEERRVERDIIHRGRHFVSEEYEKVLKSDRASARGKLYTMGEIEKRINDMQEIIGDKKDIDPVKLNKVIMDMNRLTEEEKVINAQFMKDFVEHLNAEEKISASKIADIMEHERDELNEKICEANISFGNVLQYGARNVLPLILQAGLDTAKKVAPGT